MTLKIKISEIASEVDANPLFVSLGASGQGATVTANNGFIYYVPANQNPDSFAYTADNGLGDSASGTIAVQVVKPGGVVQTITSSGSAVTLNFAGIPGYQYEVQYTANVVAGPWTTITTLAAPPDGLFTFTETPTNSPSYYRLMQH